MTISIEVTKAEILTGKGPDHIFLYTNLPDPCYPYKGVTALQISTEKGTGERWIRDNISSEIEIEIISPT